MQITLQRRDLDNNCRKTLSDSVLCCVLLKSPHNQQNKWRNLQIVSEECKFVGKMIHAYVLLKRERVSLKADHWNAFSNLNKCSDSIEEGGCGWDTIPSCQARIAHQNHHDEVVNQRQMDRQNVVIVPSPCYVISCLSDDNTSTVNNQSTAKNFRVCEVFIYFMTIQMNNSWTLSSPRIEISPFVFAERWQRVVHTRQLLFAAWCTKIYSFIFLNWMS